MPDDLGWMEPPNVPATRPCPACDGTKQVDHPKLKAAKELVEKTLEPIREQLQNLQTITHDPGHYDQLVETARAELVKSYPPMPCITCKGAGVIRMEQPGDPYPDPSRKHLPGGVR